MIDIIVDVLDKETDDIRKTLGSICYQLNMPEVYVHLEGNVPETIINHYKQFINIDNKIENLKGTHLMYINAGDVLANPYVLEKLNQFSKYDVVIGNCIKRDEDGMQYNIFDDTENCYGKLYNRDFLDKKGIIYSNGFVLNKLCMMSIPNKYFLEYKTYIIRENEDNIEEYINNVKQTIGLGKELKLYNGIFQLATDVLVDMYHDFLNDKFNIDIESLKDIALIYIQYKNEYDVFIRMSKYQFTIKDVIPEISFNEFIKKVMRQ